MKASQDPSSKFYRNPSMPEPRLIKSYCPTIIAEVLVECGLSYEIHKPDLGEDFVTIHFNANQHDFRAARVEWLQRMSVKVLGGNNHDATAEKARHHEQSDPACDSSEVSTVETEGLFA